MPEGDTVWRAAAQLHAALAGKVLTASDFRVPRFATLDLAGWTVAEVVPRGKHLLMRLLGPAGEHASQEPGPQERAGGQEAAGRRRALTIHSHLKMEGSWQIYPPGGRWKRPGHTARCVLRTGTSDVVGFSLGILEVLPTAEEHKAVGHLGPDLLGPDWDPAEAMRRLLAAPEVPLGLALLEQRNLAGIGNVYRCELCFLAGVHPASPVSSVKDLHAVLANAKRLLEANLGRGVRQTVGVGVTLPAVPRRPSHWVYGREHQPCLRCRTPIRRGVLGAEDGSEERNIYFCPHCQPAA
ncbi:DNA-formamidopyrimidine glycosylase family protein [Arthrobacter sp. CJ23]|uniref:DNA-formamidopyrimidine glycosylase family protein n=1 Tax=Arthrobacter sp. CJ23 TaxID=2972479 RepID=UPI00215D57CD|nr:DNA-formamidopyrimidine glycosylase family protein [Arthrobacter sp. CJ23]UVJ40222.1 Fpg/Nei family DNA glycosylase [Arthrobacter sp. CJ23]